MWDPIQEEVRKGIAGDSEQNALSQRRNDDGEDEEQKVLSDGNYGGVSKLHESE